MIRTLFVFAFTGLSLTVYANHPPAQPFQEPFATQDSLQAAIDALQNKELENTFRNEQAALVYEEILKTSPDSLTSHYLSELSLKLTSFPDSPIFRKVNRSAINKAWIIGDSSAVADGYWDLAYVMERYSKRDSAYFYYSEARKLFEALEDQEHVADMLQYQGYLLNLFREYLGAEADLIAALEIYEPLESTKGLYETYAKLAINSKDLGMYSQSLEYFEAAEHYLTQLKGTQQQWNTHYNNLGNLYEVNEDYPSAESYYKKILIDSTLEERAPLKFSLYTTNLGKAYYGQGRIEEAEVAYLSALKIRDSIGNPSERAASHEFLAELYHGTGRDSLARTHLYPGLELAEEGNTRDRLLNLYVLGGQIEPDKAPAYFRKYRDLDQKIHESERLERERFARIQYQTDQHIARSEQLAGRQALYLGLILGIMLLGVSLFIIIYQRIKNQKLKFEKQQQEANQEIFQMMLTQKAKVEEGKKTVQKRISEELHDGVLGEMNGIRMVLLGLNGKSDDASISLREQAIRKLQDIQEEIRGISHELSDAAYEKFHNFILSVQDMIKERCEPAGLEYTFEYDPDMDWDHLPGLTKINLHRIIQECLQNTIKHAEATKVEVLLESNGEQCEIKIRDNGKGMATSRAKKGIGHKNISSRVDNMRGDWRIKSKPGKGTEVKIKIPRSPEEAKARTLVLD